MKTPNPRRFASACVGLVIAALPGCMRSDSQNADGTGRPWWGGRDIIDLRTDGLPSPVVMSGDPLKRRVTSLEIRGKLGNDGNGKGTVIMNESPLTFNDFGDAGKTTSPPAKPCQVVFEQVKLDGKNEHRRLFEIVFADGALPQRMYLVLSTGATGPHRLLIRSGRQSATKGWFYPAHILDLQGLPKIKAPMPDAPRGANFKLSALSSAHVGGNQGLQQVTISGTTDGPASLDLDPNFLSFNACGDVVMSTLIGYQPVPATLKRSGIPDPTQQGRLLFEIVTKGDGPKARYFLVLSPTLAGPHRLLIRNGATLRHVLSLSDPNLLYQMKIQSQLAACSPREQQALDELRKSIGNAFQLKIEAGAVTELRVLGGVDAGRVDVALEGLTNLRTLDFSGSGLGPKGLPNLRHLARLERLWFSGGDIADAGLASMQPLPGLVNLGFYCCRGITDDGLAHLKGLQHLKGLWLNREDYPKPGQPSAPRVTDAGMEHLKGLTDLENLNLMGQAVTDAGLEHLKGLTHLSELYLAGDGITDAGLDHLQGMSRLGRLHLYQTRVTPAGRAALKAKLPLLNADD
ncbi:MAG: hypothetical protein NTW21_17175 [Verrucomicrobia bacterium]|nr:hypothetical protein [Verrucomicrobiota bacterium]